MKRICVWNPAFLGDAVLTLPLVQSLKHAWPDAELDFWVRKGVEPLFKAQPELRRVVAVAKRGGEKGLQGLLRLVKAMRNQDYDLMVCAHTSPRSAMVAMGSDIPLRVGYNESVWGRLAFHQTISRKFKELDEIERLLRLLEPLDIPAHSHWPELVLPEDAMERARKFFCQRMRNSETAPVLGIHPGSVWPTKRWPSEFFGEVAVRATSFGAKVLLYAGPDEQLLAQEVLDHALRLDPKAASLIRNLSGSLNIPELAASYAWLDCYLCNDSGPMHLAWAQRVPLVALFGPTTRELGFYPRGEDSTVLETGHDCRPCGKHGGRSCRMKTHACMREITPDMVWEVVEEKLRRGSRSPRRECQE